MHPRDAATIIAAHPEHGLWTVRELAGLGIADNVALETLVAHGLLTRLTDSMYASFGHYTAETLAARLQRPSYLSLEYALHTRNVLPQAAWTLTSVTLGKRNHLRVGSWALEYEPMETCAYGGYTLETDGVTGQPIPMATAEKALLDWVYCRGIADRWQPDRVASMLDDMNLDELDVEQLIAHIYTYYPERDAELLAPLQSFIPGL